MLKKIISIKNIGRFLNSSAAGDVEFKRYNLISAENGRGKSTLCSILRSLQSGDPTFILGRKTLGSPDEPEVKLLFEDARLTFRGNGWDQTRPQIAIFDNTFVTENIYSGEIIDTEHRRNLYRIILGSQGVTLARRLEQLDTDLRNKNRQLREIENLLQPNIPPGMSISGFLALPLDPDIDAKISEKQRELASVKQAEEIQQKSDLKSIELPFLHPGFAELLEKTITGVSTTVEQLVAEHIRKHAMGNHGESWLSTGLGYVNDHECPFCGQNIRGVDLLEAYSAFFSDAYHELKEEIASFISVVSSDFGDREIGRMMETVETNKACLEFWRHHCTLPGLEINKQGLSDALTNVRTEMLRLLKTKASTPLESVSKDQAYLQAINTFESAKSAVGAYNSAVCQANNLIRAKKDATDATQHAIVEDNLLRFKAIKTLHEPEMLSACQNFRTRQDEKADLENEKTSVRNELDQYIAQVVGSYEQSINRYLDRFNAGFRITRPEHTYRGGTPSSTYQIIINETPVSIGDPSTPLSQPSFKNTLSAGDKSTLAIAFFLTQLEREPDPEKKIVVFDDPFTSQDSFRRNTTCHQICRCGERHAQVIVLSHDPGFLKLLWDRIQPDDRKTLQLARVSEQNTTITEWDIEQALRCRYHADIDALSRFYSDGGRNSREIIQKLRPVLEGYCRTLYPSHFPEASTLGVIIGLLRQSGNSHPLLSIADDLDDINTYCRRYHHGENNNAANEPIDDNELNGYVKRTLKLVGCLH